MLQLQLSWVSELFNRAHDEKQHKSDFRRRAQKVVLELVFVSKEKKSFAFKLKQTFVCVTCVHKHHHHHHRLAQASPAAIAACVCRSQLSDVSSNRLPACAINNKPRAGRKRKIVCVCVCVLQTTQGHKHKHTHALLKLAKVFRPNLLCARVHQLWCAS